MDEKNVVDHLKRHLHGDDIMQTTGAKVGKNLLPWPNSTIIQVPACALVGGMGVLPRNSFAFNLDQVLLYLEIVVYVLYRWSRPVVRCQCYTGVRLSSIGILYLTLIILVFGYLIISQRCTSPLYSVKILFLKNVLLLLLHSLNL